MLKSYRLAFVPVLFLALLHFSCRNGTNQTAQQENNVAKIDSSMVAIPDPQDLLAILNGNWQNESDPADQIWIADSLITHVRNGQPMEKNTIEIDASCTARSCSSGDQPEDGWCFVEKTPSGERCMMVLKCNKKMLQIRPLGMAAQELLFRRL